MNGNGTELKQVVETNRTWCRSGWPRGFGALNTSPLLTNFRVSVALPFGARTHLPSNYLVTKKLFLYSFATSLLRRIRLGLQVMPADLVLTNNRAR